jgi:hypothetical protein
LLDVLQQVVPVLYSDREAHQARVDLDLRAGGGEVGHGSRDLDERLDATQRFGQSEQLGGFRHFDRRLASAFQDQGDHAAPVAHLLSGDVHLRMAAVEGIHECGDLGVCTQEFHDRSRVFGVTVHAHGQGLDAAQHKETVHRSGDRPDRVL